MIKFLRNVIAWNIVLVLMVSLSGCTGKRSEKITAQQTPVSSDEPKLAMTPPQDGRNYKIYPHECQIFVLSTDVSK